MNKKSIILILTLLSKNSFSESFDKCLNRVKEYLVNNENYLYEDAEKEAKEYCDEEEKKKSEKRINKLKEFLIAKKEKCKIYSLNNKNTVDEIFSTEIKNESAALKLNNNSEVLASNNDLNSEENKTEETKSELIEILNNDKKEENQKN
jgi:hypothetical protein